MTAVQTYEDEPVSAELVPTRQTVFDIPDTATQLAVAKEQAVAVTEVIDAEKLSMRIGRSEHVLFEGWATLGAFNGLTVHTVWTKRLDQRDGGDTGWEARCEVRTLDGRVVGTADAMCSRTERNWAKAEDYAIRSMAQTRAGSKAFKGPLSWVMVLAGKSGTPAEEAQQAEGSGGEGAGTSPLPGWAEPVEDVRKVVEALMGLFEMTGVEDAGARTTAIGQSIFDRCQTPDGGILPQCVAYAIDLIYDAMRPAAGDDNVPVGAASDAATPTEGPAPGPTSGDVPDTQEGTS